MPNIFSVNVHIILNKENLSCCLNIKRFPVPLPEKWEKLFYVAVLYRYVTNEDISSCKRILFWYEYFSYFQLDFIRKNLYLELYVASIHILCSYLESWKPSRKPTGS